MRILKPSLTQLRADIEASKARQSAALRDVAIGVPFRYAAQDALAGEWMRIAVPPGAPRTFALYCMRLDGADRGAVVVSGPGCPVIVHDHQPTTGGAA